MKHARLLALLLVSACVSQPRQSPDQLHAAALEQLKYGDLGQALTLAEQGLASADANADPRGHWSLRLLRTEVLLLARRLDEGRAALQTPPPDDPALRARQTYLEGQLALFSGDLPRADAVLAEAQAAADRASLSDVALAARSLRGVAQLRLGRREEGVATLTAVAREAERTGDDYQLAIALTNLGRAELDRHRFDAALPYLERAASLERVTLRIRGLALNNAGLCYTRLGDYARAVAVQTRAVEAHEGGAPIFLSQALGELGTTYAAMRSVPEATRHLRRALQVASDAGLRDLAELWAANLAAVHIEAAEWDEAERLNDQSRAHNEAARSPRLIYNLLNEGDIAFGRGNPKAALAAYQRVLSADTNDPFNRSDAHAGIARVAFAEGRRQDAATHWEEALDIIEDTQSDLQKTDYKFSYLNRITDRYGEYISALMAENRIDRALEVADSSRARVLAERHGVAARRRSSAAAFRQLAAATGSTLLLYWTGTRVSYAWAVTGSDIRYAPLPGASELEALVRDYQTAIVTSLADPVRTRDSAGDKLTALLVAPFANLLRPGASIVVVPDGPLARVNFETLPLDGPRRRYLIEDVTVTVAPSLSLITPTRRAATRTTRPDAVLLVGDPLPHPPEFPRLQHAATEMDAVVRAFPSAETAILRGERASPSAFRAAKPERFSLIHFTAHAAANAESPLDSAVILSADGSGFKLYARDIAEGRLTADLVTISACRSAGDRAYSGEGLVGFAWAFLRAGARRVLAGLWDVDDRSTAHLMTIMYAKLAEGQPPAAALRAAKLELLSQGGALAKPYYWGPFQLIASAL